MPEREIYYASLTYPELQDLLDSERTPVLLLPVSATEPHGPHGPLATDGLISMGMCRRAARRLLVDPEIRALILPPIDYAVTRYTRGFAGPVHIDEDTLHALVTGVCRSLIGMGFRQIVIVNNHFEPEHVQTLHRSLDTVEAEHGVVVGFIDLTRRERAARLTEEFRRLGAHAGSYETSLVLADAPELVRRDVARRLPPVPVSLVEAITAGLDDFREMGLVDAYNGSPAEATAADGRHSFDVLTDMLVEVVRQVARGEGGRDRPGLYTRTGGGPHQEGRR